MPTPAAGCLWAARESHNSEFLLLPAKLLHPTAYTGKEIYQEDSQSPEWVAWGGCVIPVLGGFQNLTPHIPEQPSLIL